jgi:hypothetical protein
LVRAFDSCLLLNLPQNVESGAYPDPEWPVNIPYRILLKRIAAVRAERRVVQLRVFVTISTSYEDSTLRLFPYPADFISKRPVGRERVPVVAMSVGPLLTNAGRVGLDTSSRLRTQTSALVQTVISPSLMVIGNFYVGTGFDSSSEVSIIIVSHWHNTRFVVLPKFTRSDIDFRF